MCKYLHACIISYYLLTCTPRTGLYLNCKEVQDMRLNEVVKKGGSQQACSKNIMKKKAC